MALSSTKIIAEAGSLAPPRFGGRTTHFSGQRTTTGCPVFGASLLAPPFSSPPATTSEGQRSAGRICVRPLFGPCPRPGGVRTSSPPRHRVHSNSTPRRRMDTPRKLPICLLLPLSVLPCVLPSSAPAPDGSPSPELPAASCSQAIPYLGPGGSPASLSWSSSRCWWVLERLFRRTMLML